MSTVENWPVIKTAKLPVNYERAREALEKCQRIDECKDWKDKAAALASYAKQAGDETLFKTAMRIKGRAVRRVGELLEKIEAKPGTRTDRPGSHAPTRLEVAQSAGLSKDQAVQAINVANIPKREFEKAIEAEKPPTMKALAAQGKKPTAENDHLRGRDPKDFQALIRASGAFRRFLAMTEETPIKSILRGIADEERTDELLEQSKRMGGLAARISERGRKMMNDAELTAVVEDFIRDRIAEKGEVPKSWLIHEAYEKAAELKVMAEGLQKHADELHEYVLDRQKRRSK